MCEHSGCKAKGHLWVQNGKTNIIVCGRHLPQWVRRMRNETVGSPESVVVKVGYPHCDAPGCTIWR